MPCHYTANLRLIQFKFGHLHHHLHPEDQVQNLTFLKAADMNTSLCKPLLRLRQRSKSATHIKIVSVIPNTAKLAIHTKKKNAVQFTKNNVIQSTYASVRPSTGMFQKSMRRMNARKFTGRSARPPGSLTIMVTRSGRRIPTIANNCPKTNARASRRQGPRRSNTKTAETSLW